MMDRRDFMKTVAAASLAAGVEGSSQVNAAEDNKTGAIERRALGRTGEQLSVIGFGGIIVMNQTPEESARYVAEAFERGINYFDVAPSYGNAQERLGPAFAPYRDRCFLACKTEKRDAKAAQAALEESLRLLKTDHFDLYQLHALTTVEDVEKVFAPGGAMEVFVRAREQGKTRFLGFSAHSEEAALAAMDRFDFDTILFPLNFATWMKNGFGPKVVERAKEKGMGILALKAMAHQVWPKEMKKEDRQWDKCWYQPMDDAQKAALGLRFTLGLPVTAAVPPGHWDLFKIALDAAAAGGLSPLNEAEQAALREVAEASQPLFPQHHA